MSRSSRKPATIAIVTIDYGDGRTQHAFVPIGQTPFAPSGRLERWTTQTSLDATDLLFAPRRVAIRNALKRHSVRAIELDSLGCYGSCPRFQAEFTADGKATIHKSGSRCDRRASAGVEFSRVMEAVSAAPWLRPEYPFRASDTFGARIVVTTAESRFVSEGSDETAWGAAFLATESRLDQLVRDTRWAPAVDFAGCAAATRFRL